jgi:hypothetical protein
VSRVEKPVVGDWLSWLCIDSLTQMRFHRGSATSLGPCAHAREGRSCGPAQKPWVGLQQEGGPRGHPRGSDYPHTTAPVAAGARYGPGLTHVIEKLVPSGLSSEGCALMAFDRLTMVIACTADPKEAIGPVSPSTVAVLVELTAVKSTP